MNYDIFMYAKFGALFDTIAKLTVETAMGADYLVKTYSARMLSPYAPYALNIKLTGSSRQEFTKYVMDFDGICGDDVNVITCGTLGILPDKTGLHYWGFVGYLFKLVPDLNPAFFTGHLLDLNDNNPMALFKKFSLYAGDVL